MLPFHSSETSANESGDELCHRSLCHYSSLSLYPRLKTIRFFFFIYVFILFPSDFSERSTCQLHLLCMLVRKCNVMGGHTLSRVTF